MASKRMVAKDICQSDAFLDLPHESQLVYFQLVLSADDRGYISNVKSLFRQLGLQDTAIKPLVEERFILVRGENLLLVKGWRIHNALSLGKLTETKHVEDLATLFLDENQSYTERDTGLVVPMTDATLALLPERSPRRTAANRGETRGTAGKRSEPLGSPVQDSIGIGIDIGIGKGSIGKDSISDNNNISDINSLIPSASDGNGSNEPDKTSQNQSSSYDDDNDPF